MTDLYLIRHGRPDFPLGQHVCIGKTDIPLGKIGHMQACLMANKLKSQVEQVYCSHLSRAIQTAQYLTDSPVVMEGLEEIDFGDWDGLDFEEIKERWSDLYAARAEQMDLLPDHAEPFAVGQARFAYTIRKIISSPCKQIAIVAHQAVIQSFLCEIKSIPLKDMRQIPLPYCSIMHVTFDGLHYQLKENPFKAQPELTDELCTRLLEAAKTDSNIIAHCQAVADETIRIAAQLPVSLNKKNLYLAARLHDIARTEKEHAEAGAKWISLLGYDEIASLIRQHHMPDYSDINEATVLYLADKCIYETKKVTIDERFLLSQKKCKNANSLAAHQARYELAIRLKKNINSLCGKEIVL